MSTSPPTGPVSPANDAIEHAIRARWPTGCRLEEFHELPSTNQYLMTKDFAANDYPVACIAHKQTAGVGRRGKVWLSPPDSITVSIAQTFNKPVSELLGLSLVTGLSIVSILETFYPPVFGLKWPNDVLLGERKVAGILTEIKSSGAVTTVVTGIGVNVAPGAELDGVDQPYATLADIAPRKGTGILDKEALVSRLIGDLIGGVLRDFQRFADSGWAPFADQWRQRDVLAGQPVRLSGATPVETGVAKGVSGTGALIVEADRVEHLVYSGEVSVRKNGLSDSI